MLSQTRPKTPWLVWLAVGAAAACTFEPGSWFATLQPSLTAGYVSLPDRQAGEGWQKLSNDFQVRLTRARLELDEVRFLAASAGGGGGRFDPANPPPGYTLCHGGHCHSTSGRLVPYAEIEAELAGARGGAGLQVAVTFPVDGALDLLMPAERALACEPSCNLDRTTILRASAPVRRLSLEGSVRDGHSPARLPDSSWRWELAPVLEAALNLPADRKNPPRVTVRLLVELAASLLDGLDFAALARADGVLDLAAPPNQAVAEHLLGNLARGSYFSVAVSRHGE